MATTSGNPPLTASGLLGQLYSPTQPTNYTNTGEMDSVKASLGASADQQGRTGKALVGAGGHTLEPVLQILSKLLGGDRQSAMEGAAPEVARVSDQYDSARKSIMASTPRGGARAQTIAESRLKESGDITNVLNQQRSQAMQTASQLGTNLTSLGIQATSAETQALSDLLGNLIQERGQDMSFLASLASGFSDIIGKGIEFGL